MKLRVTRTIVIEGEAHDVRDQLTRSLVANAGKVAKPNPFIVVRCTSRVDEEVSDEAQQQ